MSHDKFINYEAVQPSQDRDAECIEWGRRVLAARLLSDWELRLAAHQFDAGADGLTLSQSKQILLRWPKGQPNYALVLHEIAHAIAGPGHDSEQFHQFQYLVTEFMNPKPL